MNHFCTIGRRRRKVSLSLSLSLVVMLNMRLLAQYPGNIQLGTITYDPVTGYAALPVSWVGNQYLGNYPNVNIGLYVNADGLCLDQTATRNSVNTASFSSTNVSFSAFDIYISKTNVTLVGNYNPLIILYFRGYPGATARIGVSTDVTRIVVSSPPPVSSFIAPPDPNPTEYPLNSGYDISGHIRKPPQPYPGTPAECDGGSDLGIPNVRLDIEPAPSPACFAGTPVVREGFSTDGYYDEFDFPSHYIYKITPDKGNGTACDCGISNNSSGDIKFAQDVLLGQQDFETLQQLMAADFNGNNTFSTLDVSLMSACVHGLGVPSGWKPWVFVGQEDYNVANDPPFDYQNIPVLANNIVLDDPLTDDIPDADFYGIKRGDILEQDCTECGPSDNLASPPTDRNAWPVKNIFFEDQALDAGKEYLLPLYSGSMSKLYLLDLAFSFDPSVFEVLGFDKGLLSDDYFVTGVTEKEAAQTWHFGWFTMQTGGEQVPEQGVLLYLRVKAKKDVPSLAGLFNQNSRVRLNSAFQGENGQYYRLDLGFKPVQKKFEAHLMGENPVSTRTWLDVYMPETGKINWELISIDGKVISLGNVDGQSGWNNVLLPGRITSPGVFLLKISTNHGTSTFRLVNP